MENRRGFSLVFLPLFSHVLLELLKGTRPVPALSAHPTRASLLASANIYLDSDWLRNAKKAFLIEDIK